MNRVLVQLFVAHSLIVAVLGEHVQSNRVDISVPIGQHASLSIVWLSWITTAAAHDTVHDC
ncbi:hypothetical protein D3C80_1879200 [compost metagenome]